MDNTHGPIQQKHREAMRMLAKLVDDVLNPDPANKDMVFVILAAKAGDIAGGRVNYISNGTRVDNITMMREWIARAEGKYAEVQQGQPS